MSSQNYNNECNINWQKELDMSFYKLHKIHVIYILD